MPAVGQRLGRYELIAQIASGGMGTVDHLVDVVKEGHADAVAMADALHYERIELSAIRRSVLSAGLDIRRQ